LKNDQSSASNGSLTRRQWLGRVPPSTLAALLLGGSAGERGFASGQTESNPGTDGYGARVYNIRKYGAKGDGVALDTSALHAAIDACHHDGGNRAGSCWNLPNRHRRTQEQCDAAHHSFGKTSRPRGWQAISRSGCNTAQRRLDSERWKLGIALRCQRNQCDHRRQGHD
jgi:hypothetical protein